MDGPRYFGGNQFDGGDVGRSKGDPVITKPEAKRRSMAES